MQTLISLHGSHGQQRGGVQKHRVLQEKQMRLRTKGNGPKDLGAFFSFD